MPLSLVTAPAVLPITRQEAKDHARIEGSDEDAWIDRALLGVVARAERLTGRALLTQTWDEFFDAFPGGFRPTGGIIRPQRPPLQSVTSIKYLDTAGVEQTLDASTYRVDAVSQPGRIEPAYGTTWPATRAVSHAVTLRFVAGYGAGPGAIPDELQELIGAMLMDFAHSYRFRENAITGTTLVEVPGKSMEVYTAHRIWSF